MAGIRPIFPGEADGLAAIDTSFSTPWIYHVRSWADTSGLGFELLPVELPDPYAKRYTDVARDCDRLSREGLVAVLDDGGKFGAVIAVSPLRGNRTVDVAALYVDPAWRRQGVAQHLVHAVIPYAQGLGARALMAETQNVNYPAVQFYLNTGWRLCGVNDRYYAPPYELETALFFTYNLEVAA